MDEFVTLPTEEGINYITDWIEKNVLENREEILQKVEKLKVKYLKK
jgi:hypothetical protein